MSAGPVRPLWQGVPRGAAIATMKVLDPPPPDQRSFPEKLVHRVVHVVDDATAGVIGFTMTLLALGAGVAALAAVPAPAAAALLMSLSIVWIGACTWAALRVFREADAAPVWARGTIMLLVVVGRITAITMVVVTVIVILYLIAVILVGASRGGRSR